MHTFKTSLLIIFIAIMNVGGCVGGDDEEGCSMSCRAGALGGCPTSKEECRCAYNLYACSSFSFNEEKRRCTISGCADCALFIGRCPYFRTSQQEIALSEMEFVTVFPLEEACDIIASTDSEKDCEELTIDRECESSEFMQSGHGSFLNECWLYDCQQCLLESSITDEEVVE
jgi:hypothetical protein